MCPTEITPEEEEAIVLEAEASVEGAVSEKPVSEEEAPEGEVTPEQEYEGVDYGQEIPKGKEKHYGL